LVDGEAKEIELAKPPKTPPASDLDGVDEDEVRNVDAAVAAGQSAEDLARAKKDAKGRPEYHGDEEAGDDRSG
jgi:hypothetical protein